MAPWQSFILAWFAAQVLPVLVEEPSLENFLAIGSFLISLLTLFAGLNSLTHWAREVLAHQKHA